MRESRSYIATPPGATIKEMIEERKFSQKEFAVRMGLSEKHVSKLINGEVQLTQDVAYRLEMVLGVPAKFWNNLESIYREKLERIKEENGMDRDKVLSRQYPYSQMAEQGWVPQTRDSFERVVNLRKFFEVSRLDILEEESFNRIACRRLGFSEKADYALRAWSQQARLEARNIDTGNINLKRLKSELPFFRSMTSENPMLFCPQLKEILSDCGVAIVFLSHIGGSFLHGATFIDGKKIVMALTVRGKAADRFWFSFFHEIAHILLGHINREEGIGEKEEKEADEFAKNILIPSSDFDCFVNKEDFSVRAVSKFAYSISIDPGIVVGRLQKENYIGYDCLNDLKVKYEISK